MGRSLLIAFIHLTRLRRYNQEPFIKRALKKKKRKKKSSGRSNIPIR